MSCFYLPCSVVVVLNPLNILTSLISHSGATTPGAKSYFEGHGLPIGGFKVTSFILKMPQCDHSLNVPAKT